MFLHQWYNIEINLPTLSMTTPQETAPAVTSAPANPHFGVQRIYLKGASLELPAGARLFLHKGPLDVNLAVQVDVSALDEGVHEVTLRTTLTATIEKKVAYLLEVQQSGIFEVRNADEQQRQDMLEVGAPSILGPYLRAQLADLLTRATLPAFFLPEIDWHSMAMTERAKRDSAPVVGDQPSATLLH